MKFDLLKAHILNLDKTGKKKSTCRGKQTNYCRAYRFYSQEKWKPPDKEI